MKIMLHDNFGDKEVEAGDDGHLLASNPLLTQQGHCQAWSGQRACRVPIDLKDLFKSRPIDQNTPVACIAINLCHCLFKLRIFAIMVSNRLWEEVFIRIYANLSALYHIKLQVMRKIYD